MWAWIVGHYKPLVAIGPLMFGAIFGVIQYTEGIDTRLDMVEADARMDSQADSTTFEIIRRDLGIIKCMVVLHAQNRDPILCELE